MKRLRIIALGMIGIAAFLVFVIPLKTSSQTLPASVGCIYCACNKKVYAEIKDCESECKAGMGCFTGICGPVSIPGRPASTNPSDGTGWQREGDDKTYSEKEAQAMVFPNLKCFSVIAEPDPSYNCIASTVGESVPIWWQVDKHYGGNGDGIVTVDEFDSYYSYGGYVTSANCQIEAGKHKIALFGKQQPDGTIEPTHAASQSAFQGAGGDWWESKEGKRKKALHKLKDMEGDNGYGYGKVIKCYERKL